MKNNLVLIYLFTFIDYGKLIYNELVLDFLILFKITMTKFIALSFFIVELIIIILVLRLALNKNSKSIYNWIIPYISIIFVFYYSFIPRLGFSLLDLLESDFTYNTNSPNLLLFEKASNVLVFFSYVYVFLFYIKENLTPYSKFD